MAYWEERTTTTRTHMPSGGIDESYDYDYIEDDYYPPPPAAMEFAEEYYAPAPVVEYHTPPSVVEYRAPPSVVEVHHSPPPPIVHKYIAPPAPVPYKYTKTDVHEVVPGRRHHFLRRNRPVPPQKEITKHTEHYEYRY
jgi:hypothetical protein